MMDAMSEDQGWQSNDACSISLNDLEQAEDALAAAAADGAAAAAAGDGGGATATVDDRAFNTVASMIRALLPQASAEEVEGVERACVTVIVTRREVQLIVSPADVSCVHLSAFVYTS
jgi:hypothetical protein